MSQENQASRRVGDRLRQVREQKGITVAEAAERLHILPSYVNAMETGRYGVLPGTVFLRGYVRSYARLLRLNEDEVVAQLDRELGATDEGSAKRQVEVQETYKSSRRNLTVMLVAAAILVLGAFWFLQQEDAADYDRMAEQSEDGRQQDSAAYPGYGAGESERLGTSGTASEPSSTRSGSPEALTDNSGSSASGTTADAGVDAAPTGVAPTGLPATGLPATRTEIDQSAASQQSSPGAATSTQAAPQPAAPQPAAPESPEVAGQDRLEVRFTGECWFELTDAAGGRRRGLFQEGDSFVHTGPAPFKLVVGAVSETQLVFNGSAVDFSQYRVRGNRLGLTLGQ